MGLRAVPAELYPVIDGSIPTVRWAVFYAAVNSIAEGAWIPVLALSVAAWFVANVVYKEGATGSCGNSMLKSIKVLFVDATVVTGFRIARAAAVPAACPMVAQVAITRVEDIAYVSREIFRPANHRLVNSSGIKTSVWNAVG